MTRSPGRTLLTPAPTSFTTPASSLPGENGSGGLNWYLFWMMRKSGKLTLAAFTETTTSPGPGLGDGSSSTTSDSGGPYCLQSTAFIAIECHMPTVTTDDGVRLHYEETGRGTPLIFVHEFGGDLRSWEPQVRHFSRFYRCIRYNARVRRVPRAVQRAFGARLGQHAPRRAVPPALLLRPGGAPAEHDRADVPHAGRRGGAGARGQYFAQALHPHRRARRLAAERARH